MHDTGISSGNDVKIHNCLVSADTIKCRPAFVPVQSDQLNSPWIV